MDPFKVDGNNHFGLDKHLDLIKELQLTGRTKRSQRLAGYVKQGVHRLKNQIGSRRIVNLNLVPFRRLGGKRSR